MRKSFTVQEKLSAVHDYLNGNRSQKALARDLGTKQSVIQRWITNYQSLGELSFLEKKSSRYSTELKYSAVNAYLMCEGSLRAICRKYKIKSETQLSKWISLYNGHKELKASGTGGSRLMTEGRKTTFEERVEIASYCISRDRNYAETSEKFKVSYQQARNYTIKYEAGGVTALQDNRGKRKTEDTLTEVEKLQAELKLEKAKRQRAEMELSFLKKLEEIERRRG